MSSSPVLLGGERFETGADAVATGGITVTAHASANTKGTPVELIASTAFASSGFRVFMGASSGAGDYLVDICIGAALSELVIVANIPYGSQSAGRVSEVYIPIAIPAGTRISAAIQATTGARTLGVAITLGGAGALNMGSFQRAVTYGAATADSGGTGLDPGGTANTKPAGFTEVISATTAPIRYLLLGFGNRNNSAVTGTSWLVDIAIGASSSELVVVPNFRLSTSGTTDHIEPVISSLPVSIPVGSRLSARCQCGTNDATDRLIDIILIGVC